MAGCEHIHGDIVAGLLASRGCFDSSEALSGGCKRRGLLLGRFALAEIAGGGVFILGDWRWNLAVEDVSETLVVFINAGCGRRGGLEEDNVREMEGRGLHTHI